MMGVILKVTIPEHRYERLGWGFLEEFLADLTRATHGFLQSARNCQYNVLVEVYVPKVCFNFPDVLIEIRSFVALEAGHAQTQVNSIMELVTVHRVFSGEGFNEVRVILEDGRTSKQFRAEFNPPGAVGK
jgi:hypothetical protein